MIVFRPGLSPPDRLYANFALMKIEILAGFRFSIRQRVEPPCQWGRPHG